MSGDCPAVLVPLEDQVGGAVQVFGRKDLASPSKEYGPGRAPNRNRVGQGVREEKTFNPK
eukprot:CAMPEP_0182891380 /NCGR_PEP_ID=MMETSP0034_2-20130328/23222_1 /TAXON_ID=156128 /ORGANISM="Nephroselmis pyriformis, Strain CCMP717" /LENGTH=59 /DNA_ID=CAMNT_0025024985 /DNA_START=83 /DNA_END=259 /DNA_ORIENTATION=+